jgi:predicted esterase
MLRCLRLALAVVCVSFLAFAQAPDTRQLQELNQKLNEAITAKRWDDGIAALEKILEITPKDKGSAYNLACLESLQNRLDKAFAWLEKAVEWGWGQGTRKSTIIGNPKPMSEAEMCAADPDFENMRKDPRWEPLMKKLAANAELAAAKLKKGEEYAAAPAMHVPEAAKALAEKPVLVVVHEAGTTKEQVVAGFWKDVAEELGFVLLAPSGKILIGDTPSAKGMAWYEDVNEYLANGGRDAWKFEKTIHEAVSTFKKTDKLDRSRVVLVGDGQMGTLVAFGAGISSPGLYKAVLGVDGTFAPALVQPKAAQAGKMGQKASLLLDEQRLAGETPEEKADGAKALETLRKVLTDAGLGTATTYPHTEDAKTRVQLVAATIRAQLAASAAAAAQPAPGGGTPAPAPGGGGR